MNRQWMYGNRRTSEYIDGVHNFLAVAEANKKNGFMCCPCPNYGNTWSYSESKTLHTHLLYKGFMPHYNVWTKHGERGVMMEDNNEEEDDDNYVPLNMVMLQRGKLKMKRNQTMCPMMIFAGSLLMQRDSAKVKGEAEVRSHVRGSQKRVVAQLRRWKHKAW